MASTILYPPILERNQMPHIKNGNEPYKIYFSLPKFDLEYRNVDGNNILTDIFAHVYIYDFTNNKPFVNLTDDTKKIEGENHIRYREVGRVLNVDIHKEKDDENYFYINLYDNDFGSNESSSTSGMIAGNSYKIQIRFSFKAYPDGVESSSPADWLKKNSLEFSEWSYMTVAKVIKPLQLTVNFNQYDTKSININDYEIGTLKFVNDIKKNILGIKASLSQIKANNTANNLLEPIKQYSFILTVDNEVKEKTGNLFITNFETNEQQDITYTFKTVLKKGKNIKVEMNYITINGFKGKCIFTNTLNIEDSTPEGLTISIPAEEYITTSYLLHKIENEVPAESGIALENEEGYVQILVNSTKEVESKKIVLKRSSHKTNFTEWETIQKWDYKTGNFIFNDFTIESGIWYKYGIEIHDSSDSPESSILIADSLVRRIFEHTYLLGEETTQLKIMLNETMSSYKINTSDSTLTTINSKHPFATRVGESYYKSFSIGGIISFNDDDNALFLPKITPAAGSPYMSEEFQRLLGVYGKDNADLAEAHYEYNLKHQIDLRRDETYERFFREKVIEFLMTNNPKLYKTATEGNVLVQLSGVSFTPNEQLGRLIYTFSATATEIGEANLDNYRLYNLIKEV